MGCRGVPELAFDQDAATDDARSAADASVVRDARSDGTVLVDAKIDDGSDAWISEGDARPFDTGASDADDRDASLADSSLVDSSALDATSVDAGEVTCPAAPPPGASVCCKGVPCHGDISSCNSECTNCANNCAGKTCCLDGNGNYHGCANSPADCPP